MHPLLLSTTHLLSRLRGLVTERVIASCARVGSAPTRRRLHNTRRAATAPWGAAAAAGEAARGEQRLPNPVLLAAPGRLARVEALLP